MFGLLNDVIGLATDVAKVAIAPVEVVASVARAVTKPVAELAEDMVKAARDELR